MLAADASEAELLAHFTEHPLFRDIEQLAGDAFLEVLLQRRFLSLLFTVIYDIAIDGLTDTASRRLVRVLLREEYPDAAGKTPSHREDLVHDLISLGATKTQILATRPSPATASVILETLELMSDAVSAEDDIGVLTILRFWGEVLVAVEYGQFLPRMQATFESSQSRFYYPHFSHDGCEPLEVASDFTHSGQLGICLMRLLTTDGAVEQFVRTERQLLAGRMRFYDQFLPNG